MTLGMIVTATTARAQDAGSPAVIPATGQEPDPTPPGVPARAEATNASPGSPLRGDGRLIGFVSTPFGGNQDGSGVGFGVAANIGWGQFPASIGFDVMTAFLGDASSTESLRTGNTVTAVRRDRSDKAYFFDLSLRLQPVRWWARPYVEGVVGTKMLETKYTLSFPDSGASTSAVTDHDWAGSIGWGAGVDLGSLQGGVFLTLGVRRLNGANASFSRAIDAGGNTVVRYDSPTSTTFWMLGLAGAFGSQGASQ